MKQRSLSFPKSRTEPRPLPARQTVLELPEDYGEGLEPSDEPVPEWMMLPFIDEATS